MERVAGKMATLIYSDCRFQLSVSWCTFYTYFTVLIDVLEKDGGNIRNRLTFHQSTQIFADIAVTCISRRSICHFVATYRHLLDALKRLSSRVGQTGTTETPHPVLKAQQY